MSDDSKKSKKEEKRLKAKVFELFEKLKRRSNGKEIGPPLERAIKILEKSLEGEAIPPELTIASGEEDPEQELISIRLRPRCLDDVEKEEIQKEATKSLVHKFMEIGRMTRNVAQSSGVMRDKVPNQGEYAFLYSGLSPDVEIFEVQYSGTGRIFGFFTGSSFNVVCVRVNHIENH